MTENGDCLYWLARTGQEPAQGTVAIKEGRGGEWEFHARSCSEFLRSVLLTGDTESDIFCDLPTQEPHEFASSARFV